MRSRQAGTALTFACAQPVARRITKIRRRSALRCASQAVGLGWDDSPGAEEDPLAKDPSLLADSGTRSAAPAEERPFSLSFLPKHGNSSKQSNLPLRFLFHSRLMFDISKGGGKQGTVGSSAQAGGGVTHSISDVFASVALFKKREKKANCRLSDFSSAPCSQIRRQTLFTQPCESC